MYEKKTNPFLYGMVVGLMFILGYIGTLGLQNIFAGDASIANFMMFGVGAAGGTFGLVAVVSFLMNDRSFETVQEAVEGDVQELQEGNISPGMWRLIISIIATLIFAFLFFKFHKYSAEWDWYIFKVPVWLIAAISVVVTRLMIKYTPWYADTYRDVPWYFFAAFTLCLVVAVSLGISQTEDMRLFQRNFQANDSSYNYYHYNYYVYSGGGGSSDSDISIDDDAFKNMGEAICCIAIILMFAILIIGTAFIGSFWVVSGSIFLTFMWSDTWQALQLE